MIDLGPKIIHDLQNYELRETMMICGTMAWNGILRGLSNNGDWACHRIEHALSAVYDIPHGEGLAIVTPQWMEHCIDINPEKIKRLATNVFQIKSENKSDKEIAYLGVQQFKNFLISIGAPTSMQFYNIKEYDVESLVEKSMLGKKEIGNYVKLSSGDVRKILERTF